MCVCTYPADGNDNDDIDDNAPIRRTITDSWSLHFNDKVINIEWKKLK
jgi:hypothetical protein